MTGSRNDKLQGIVLSLPTFNGDQFNLRLDREARRIGWLLDQGLNDGNLTYDELISLPGIGLYAASHVRLLLHDFSRIPVDSAVSRSLRARYGLAPEEIDTFFERWGRISLSEFQALCRINGVPPEAPVWGYHGERIVRVPDEPGETGK